MPVLCCRVVKQVSAVRWRGSWFVVFGFRVAGNLPERGRVSEPGSGSRGCVDEAGGWDGGPWGDARGDLSGRGHAQVVRNVRWTVNIHEEAKDAIRRC